MISYNDNNLLSELVFNYTFVLHLNQPASLKQKDAADDVT